MMFGQMSSFYFWLSRYLTEYTLDKSIIKIQFREQST